MEFRQIFAALYFDLMIVACAGRILQTILQCCKRIDQTIIDAVPDPGVIL
ncbi:hypothetical protein TevJSym_bo00220 [endosymbiont of Tevnia jerichonana (vent Tica)]|uniref:Uncharacterized protein n=1 Tax=endosymbiont of Tevnia jerichonana (vent Tica) TaxID=1049564 RepID=G2FJH2_9GAMM|nr:hypothetical protein TevJSym_bo00220 [endosymbiont of Tevnia jerichonana (vent Tica)]